MGAFERRQYEESLRGRVQEAIKDPKFQTIAASSVGGAAAVGTTGGVIGLGAGTIVGAAVGVIPAVFTFGLSIPIGAVVGGTIGLSSGATIGAGVGAVGGSVVGYGRAN